MTFEIYRQLKALPRPNRAACEVYSDPSYYNEGRERHNHELLFKFTLAGCGIFRVRGKEHRLPPGTGFLCRVSDPNIAWYYPSDGTEPWEFIWLIFEGKTAEALVREMNQRYGHIYQLPTEARIIRQLLSTMEHARIIYSNPDHDWKTMVMPAAEGGELVMGLLTRLLTSTRTESADDHKALVVGEAQEMVLRMDLKNVSVAEIADRIGISPEHLSRLFKELTGSGPGEYILKQKIQVACHLLKETNLSCKEIAARLGYNDQANFTRAFQSITHTTPTNFRKTGSTTTL
ncbi:MAG: AraC family transcriptional regulator [Verrucomicrobiota bacterium]